MNEKESDPKTEKKEGTIISISEAIKDLTNYSNKRKAEIKKRNEEDYREIEMNLEVEKESKPYFLPEGYADSKLPEPKAELEKSEFVAEIPTNAHSFTKGFEKGYREGIKYQNNKLINKFLLCIRIYLREKYYENRHFRYWEGVRDTYKRKLK